MKVSVQHEEGAWDAKKAEFPTSCSKQHACRQLCHPLALETKRQKGQFARKNAGIWGMRGLSLGQKGEEKACQRLKIACREEKRIFATCVKATVHGQSTNRGETTRGPSARDEEGRSAKPNLRKILEPSTGKRSRDARKQSSPKARFGVRCTKQKPLGRGGQGGTPGHGTTCEGREMHSPGRPGSWDRVSSGKEESW